MFLIQALYRPRTGLVQAPGKKAAPWRDPDDCEVFRDVQPLELVMEDTPVALSPIQVTSSSFSKT